MARYSIHACLLESTSAGSRSLPEEPPQLSIAPGVAIARCLANLASAHPELHAWRQVEALAREFRGEHADHYLATCLGSMLDDAATDRREGILAALTRILVEGGIRSPLVASLASNDSPSAHLLALALMARITPPLQSILLQPAQALLLDRRLPEEGQLALAAVLLRTLEPHDDRIEHFLKALVSGLGKSRSLTRLRLLEERSGKHPSIDALCTQLEDRLRMACPRCGTSLRRPEMIRHLWEAHQLVLAGRRVREPWGVIEDWLEAYAVEPDPELLQRCRALAGRIDPEAGVARVQRLLLSHGIRDAESLSSLCEDAAEHHASLCPNCFHPVSVPRPAPPLVIYERPGHLSAGGYAVDLSEQHFWTRLVVRTPMGPLYRGREPKRYVTPGGASAAVSGPLVFLALFAAHEFSTHLAFRGTLVFLSLAIVGALLAHLFWSASVPLAARVRNYAWTLLVPHLHKGGFCMEDAAFIAGLAEVSRGDGYGVLRGIVLPELLRGAERAVLDGRAPVGYLAPLRRLAIEDSAAGADAVPLVADAVARCFEGKMPLALADRLLADWKADWWTAGNLARLRLLICDRAFASGFEVRNLLDAAITAPALADVLDSDDPIGLAALRLLWSARAAQPWHRCGQAATAFELAENVGHASLLARYPDLLLYQELESTVVAGDGGQGQLGPAEIIVTARAVLLQDVAFAAPPRLTEVEAKSMAYVLRLGEAVFRGPAALDTLALRMERWFRFAFHEFLPQVAAAQNWEPPDRTAIMRAWGPIPCATCGAESLPRVGGVGVPLRRAKKVK